MIKIKMKMKTKIRKRKINKKVDMTPQSHSTVVCDDSILIKSFT